MPKPSYISRLLANLNTPAESEPDNFEFLELEPVYHIPLAIESTFGNVDSALNKLKTDQKILRAKLKSITEELRQVDIAIVAVTAARDVLVNELQPVAITTENNILHITNT